MGNPLHADPPSAKIAPGIPPLSQPGADLALSAEVRPVQGRVGACDFTSSAKGRRADELRAADGKSVARGPSEREDRSWNPATESAGRGPCPLRGSATGSRARRGVRFHELREGPKGRRTESSRWEIRCTRTLRARRSLLESRH